MMSVYPVLFAVMLFSEMNSHFIAVASTIVEDGAAEQEGLDSILAEEGMTGQHIVPLMYRRSFLNDGGSKVIFIPDMNHLEGRSFRGLKSALTRSYPLITEQSWDSKPEEFTLKKNKREKDLDMLRCMIGRVYRPCWED